MFIHCVYDELDQLSFTLWITLSRMFVGGFEVSRHQYDGVSVIQKVGFEVRLARCVGGHLVIR